MKTLYLVLVLSSGVLGVACARRSCRANDGEAAELFSDRPVACNLGALSPQERERSQALRGELFAEATSRRELADGYAFSFDRGAGVLRKLAEWVELERRCCPFLSFDLHWGSGEGDAPELRLRGSAAAKEFLAGELSKAGP